MPVGALPPQLALACGISAMTEELAVQASLTGDPHAVLQAIAYDPNTNARLALAQTREMVNRMFVASADFLPQFAHKKV